MASELGFSLTAVLAASVGIGGVAWLLGSWLARAGKRRLGRGDGVASLQRHRALHPGQIFYCNNCISIL